MVCSRCHGIGRISKPAPLTARPQEERAATVAAGIPAIGAAVVGWASVQASQGKLNIGVVRVVAMLGAEVGGLAGYSIGAR